MRFSLSTEYAIHGLLFLALRPADGVTMLSEVARALGVSESSLRKVFQNLARHGLLTSYRGLKGGYSLRLSPQDITLQDVVQATEGAAAWYHCIQAQRRCEPGPRCVIGSAFQEVEAQIGAVLRNVTLADLATRVQDGSKEIEWHAAPPSLLR